MRPAKPRPTKFKVKYEDNAFVHCSVSFIEGRSMEVKGDLGRRMLRILCTYYGAVPENLKLQISVEIQDIPRPLYFKFPELI